MERIYDEDGSYYYKDELEDEELNERRCPDCDCITINEDYSGEYCPNCGWNQPNNIGI